MRFATVWQQLLGVEHEVVEGVLFDEDEGAIVASIRRADGRRALAARGRPADNGDAE